jgi:ATP-dependent Lhr-like helicase
VATSDRSPLRGAASRPRPVAGDPLDAFRPATRDWFRSAFAVPTPAQSQGWPAIAAGRHTLICAPTGSGKTLAAFLWCIDGLLGDAPPSDAKRRLRVLYVSPLKALVHDVERNLRAPLAGIERAAEALGQPSVPVRVGMRTGDTPAEERRAFGRHPPDILVTTPESLYLLLTSEAREALRGIRTVIVDEIHALAATKRGAHLALSLERLEAITDRPPQRIGLSATQRPLSAVGAFLAGRAPAPGSPGEPADPDSDGPLPPRAVTIVDAGVRKPLELQVVVPVEDMSRLGELISLDESPGGPATRPDERVSIWPSVYPRILELIRAHRSTIVFVNSRRLAERIAQRLNELAGEELVRAHHGSIAREQRVGIEEALKAGRLPALVATSSLELGIDMGAVDLVIQVESPMSVARGLQRVGRAGHTIDEPSRGVIFPKYRGDLLECAVVTRGMHDGAIETTTIPRSPLDVLAQQVVAASVGRTWPVDELFGLVRRAENFATLGRDVFEAVLGMLAGQYPSDEFRELRPRIAWDRVAGTVRARGDARTVAVVSGGTIPDRGLFGVYLDEGLEGGGGRARDRARRVGELDEEMVYEARAGEVILLGASAWRIERITHDRVLVSPAPGQQGSVPFWKGDGVGRPVELGRALGAFTRELEDDLLRGVRGRHDATERLRARHDLDALAAENLLAYLDEERGATGVLPTDRTIVIERFHDELGDWRVVLLSPFGGRVHAPWALAIEAILRESLGMDVQPLWSDDGIVIRVPATDDPGWYSAGPTADDPAEGSVAAEAGGDGSIAIASPDAGRRHGPDAVEAAMLVDPDAIEELVMGALGGSALFAARFRENAARALLLPRQHGGQRRPLWQMRQRAAQLLGVASRYGSFPIVLETYRECLQDVFDLPALRDILAAVRRRDIAVRSVETRRASPFASSLLFDYIAAYMYEGDAPLADRRAQALALDRDLLRELLGAEELRELLDQDALSEIELELQSLVPSRAATSADRLHDLLRRLGDLSEVEAAGRVAGLDGRERDASARAWLGELEQEHRAVRVRIAGEERWIAIEDSGLYRDALGCSPPPGVPDEFLAAAGDPLSSLVGRFARSHGPFLPGEPAGRWGLSPLAIERVLERMLAAGTVLRGEFRPGGAEREWCDPDVLRSLRRRSLARLRREVEPVEAPAYARFLAGWHGIAIQGQPARGASLDRLVEIIAQIEGLPVPASALEADILPSRIPGYVPRLLDELGAAGEVAWVGRGRLGRDDGRVALFRPDRLALLLQPAPADDASPPGWIHAALLDHLGTRGASFFRDLAASAAAAARERGESQASERDLLDALWDLAWAGLVTNDTFAPLRALRWRRGSGGIRPRGARLVPPEGSGRWSIVREAIATSEALAGGPPSPTAHRHAVALALLERQGIVTRDGVAGEEAIAGGFGSVYPVLREMEERGRIRRGYFVEGLGGAQFALPGAVDRLRAERRSPGGDTDAGATAILIAATDPAQPYGATLAWPRAAEGDRRQLARVAGAHVVLVGGEPALYLERGGRSLLTLPALAGERGEAVPGGRIDPDVAVGALAELVRSGRVKSLQIERVDGARVAESPLRVALESAGFRRGYRGWILARSPGQAT